MNAVIAVLMLLPILTICGLPWQISALIVRNVYIAWLAIGVIHFFQGHVIVYSP